MGGQQYQLAVIAKGDVRTDWVVAVFGASAVFLPSFAAPTKPDRQVQSWRIWRGAGEHDTPSHPINNQQDAHRTTLNRTFMHNLLFPTWETVLFFCGLISQSLALLIRCQLFPPAKSQLFPPAELLPNLQRHRSIVILRL
jgi:hypothetical protein